MTDPIAEKINEFTERLDKEDTAIVFNELSIYLQGLADNELNPMMKQQIQGYMISLKIAGGVSDVDKKLGNKIENIKSQHNSLLERFNKLEQKFNDEIARK